MNWLSNGARGVLISDLGGARSLYAFSAEGIGNAYASHAGRAIQGSFEIIGDRLRLHATIEDLSSRRIARQFELEAPRGNGPGPLIDRLAKAIDPAARTFGTHDPSAFASFGEAFSVPDIASRARLLQAATTQDPNFAPAYADLADSLVLLNQLPQAQTVATEGLRHASDALDRAQLAYVLALTQGNGPGRKKALEDLARLLPANPEPWLDLAGISLRERDFVTAVRDYQEAARVDPADPQIYNQLGYAEAYAGDLAASRNSLLQYQRLAADGDLNPLDSLGEVSFYLGDFAAAERYFVQSGSRNPGSGEILKAAQARLMLGDLPGADVLFDQYSGQGKTERPVLLEYRRAQWEFLTGRRKQALSRVQKLTASATGDAAALADAQLAVWSAQVRQSADASRYADASLAAAQSPGARNVAALCKFLTAPAWKPSNNPQADAYALVLAGRFSEAIPSLEAIYRATPPSSDGEVRTLLAWAYQKTGQSGKVRELTRLYPIPLAQSESLFSSLAFPRFLQVKGLPKLFDQFKGDLPDL